MRSPPRRVWVNSARFPSKDAKHPTWSSWGEDLGPEVLRCRLLDRQSSDFASLFTSNLSSALSKTPYSSLHCIYTSWLKRRKTPHLVVVGGRLGPGGAPLSVIGWKGGFQYFCVFWGETGRVDSKCRQSSDFASLFTSNLSSALSKTPYSSLHLGRRGGKTWARRCSAVGYWMKGGISIPDVGVIAWINHMSPNPFYIYLSLYNFIDLTYYFFSCLTS
jgi:hypothetical protein